MYVCDLWQDSNEINSDGIKHTKKQKSANAMADKKALVLVLISLQLNTNKFKTFPMSPIANNGGNIYWPVIILISDKAKLLILGQTENIGLVMLSIFEQE